MKHRFTVSGLILVLLFGCAEPQWQYLEAQMFQVSEVLSGNRIKLNPGYEVVLLGVNSSPKAEEYLRQNLMNQNIRLVLDNNQKDIFSMTDRPFYAYVMTYQSPHSINGKLLREGYAALDFTHLTDSLNKFSNFYHDSPINKVRAREGDIRSTSKQLTLASEKVTKHAHKILSQLTENPGTNKTKYQQVCSLWKHTYNSWYYIHDPNALTDTWRTAEETIDLFFNNGGKYYSGDCDDFAILNCALVKSIGLPTRFIAAGGINGSRIGHAYAEFFVEDAEWAFAHNNILSFFQLPSSTEIAYKPGSYKGVKGRWVNLDWWAPHVGGIFYPGKREIVENEL